jgi:YesN/AraC family two-component response regulator
MDSENPGVTNNHKCSMLWLDLTIYGSKLEQYTLLKKYCDMHMHSIVKAEIFSNQAVDVIVLEYDYPVKQSLETLTNLKSEHPSIPIIMLTEQHSEELAVWAFRARAWDFFVKPLAQDKLLASVDAILEIKNKYKSREERVAVTPPNIKPMDTRFRDINEEYLAIAPALSFLDSNYQKKVSENTLASLCGMNPFRFSRCFKKEIGITLQEYLVRLRIREALRLLDNPNASITDIAFTVGFNDTSYFSRTFKKYMNYSPSAFRSIQQENIDSTDKLSMVPGCIKDSTSEESDWSLLQQNIKLMNELGQQKHAMKTGTAGFKLNA